MTHPYWKQCIKKQHFPCFGAYLRGPKGRRWCRTSCPPTQKGGMQSGGVTRKTSRVQNFFFKQCQNLAYLLHKISSKMGFKTTHNSDAPCTVLLPLLMHDVPLPPFQKTGRGKQKKFHSLCEINLFVCFRRHCRHFMRRHRTTCQKFQNFVLGAAASWLLSCIRTLGRCQNFFFPQSEF